MAVRQAAGPGRKIKRKRLRRDVLSPEIILLRRDVQSPEIILLCSSNICEPSDSCDPPIPVIFKNL
jgi:hypothetical protein